MDESQKNELIIYLDKQIKMAERGILGIADAIGLLKQSEEYDTKTQQIMGSQFHTLKLYMMHTALVIQNKVTTCPICAHDLNLEARPICCDKCDWEMN